MGKAKGKKNVKKSRTRLCFYCGGQYNSEDVDIHMHSYVHHEAIDNLKLREHHTCFACNVFMTGLKPYNEHISTHKHASNLYKLHMEKNKKHLNLYNIDLTRDETVALEKARRKNKKRQENCFVCGQIFQVQNIDEHMHSIFHHQRIVQLKGSPQEHKCFACGTSETGMAKYNQHLATYEHKFNMFVLQKDTADGIKVDYNAEIDDELRRICVQRDEWKKRPKIETKKKKKLTNKKTETCTSQPVPVMDNTPFTNDLLPPSCYFSWQHQNDHSASVKFNQNVSKQRQKSMFDRNGSNEPPVKRPCFETPSVICPQNASTPGTHPSREEGGEVEVWVNTLLRQSRIEATKPNMPTTGGETTGNEAVVPRDSVHQHSHSNESAQKYNTTASAFYVQGTRQEPNVDSLQSVTSPAKKSQVESQTSENDWQVSKTVEVQTCTVHVKEETSHESLENACNIQKKQDISLNPNPEANKKSKVKKLLMLSSKEDELTCSLEHVGEQLFQAYSTLESVRVEVQHLLAVKRQVTSEMASLREKRLKILQDMKDVTCSSNSDQQVVLNAL